jgi:hypothetical protein
MGKQASLRDVSPSLAVAYRTQCRGIDASFSRQRPERLSGRQAEAQLDHPNGCQFGLGVTLSLEARERGDVPGELVGLHQVAGAPLVNSVLHILTRRAREQVRGVNASAVVATVTDKHARRDRAVRPLVGQAVRETLRVAARQRNTQQPVANAVSAGRPFPAIVGPTHADLGPEPFFDASAFSNHGRDIMGKHLFYQGGV